MKRSPSSPLRVAHYQFYIMYLAEDKQLPTQFEAFCSPNTESKTVSIPLLIGLYAFCLAMPRGAEKKECEPKQLLMLKPFDYYQSNHNAFKFLLLGQGLKAGYEIKCGGEVVFYQGQLLSWNLKSGAFSLDSPYNETNENFNNHHRQLQLPSGKYQSHSRDPYQYTDFFAGNGDFLKNKHDDFIAFLARKPSLGLFRSDDRTFMSPYQADDSAKEKDATVHYGHK